MELQEFREYDDRRLCDFVRRRKVPWRGIVLRPNVQSSHEGDIDCIPLHDHSKDRIKTDRWVGTFSLTGHHYTIIPRIGQNRFWSLLKEAEGVVSTAGDLSADGGVTGGQLSGRTILALLWTSALEHGRRLHGVTKGYVFRHEPDAYTLKGQIDLYRQLTENDLGNQHRIACIYDDLTFDNPVNRAILYTINTLKSEGIFPFSQSNPRRERLMDWHERLTSLGVKTGKRIFPGNRIRWTRANDGFRRSHELAERLSRHRGAERTLEGLDDAILFDSAEVWEVFLWERLRRVVAGVKGDSLRIHSPRLQNGHFRNLMTYKGIARGGLLPDFTLQRKNPSEERWQTVAILDAKYRSLEAVRGRWLPKSEEVTQMALYSCNSGTEENRSIPCALLYPRAEASGNSSGINTSVENKPERPAGEAELSIAGKPMLSWWMIDLSEPDIRRKWIEEVDAQLKSVIIHLLTSRNNHKTSYS